jgi:hypothetical protein
MQKERLILLELLNILSNFRCQKIKVTTKFQVPYRRFITCLKGRKPQNAKEGYNKALDFD